VNRDINRFVMPLDATLSAATILIDEFKRPISRRR
jgi:hypothetical protein